MRMIGMAVLAAFVLGLGFSADTLQAAPKKVIWLHRHHRYHWHRHHWHHHHHHRIVIIRLGGPNVKETVL